jgi:hypothetical protein
MLPALLIVVIRYFPLQPTVVLGVFTVFDPIVFSLATEQPHPAVPCRSGTRGDRHAHSGTQPPWGFDYACGLASQLR